jgi:hypothetical protein
LYEPDSYKNVGGSYIWYDKTSNQQNATISANPSISTVNVSNGTLTFQALQGTVNDRITFPSGILPSTYTLITVARYSPAGTARGRIFDGFFNNWLSGFWSGQVGVAFHDVSWMTPSRSPNGSDLPIGQTSSNVAPAAVTDNTTWVISSDTNDGYWYNGFNRLSNQAGGKNSAVLSVNKAGGENSDWQIAFIAVYNRKLSTVERVLIEQFLSSKFGIPVASSSTVNSTTKTVKADAVIPQLVSDFCNNSWQRTQSGYGTNVQNCIADIMENKSGIPPNVTSQQSEYLVQRSGYQFNNCWARPSSGGVFKDYNFIYTNGFKDGANFNPPDVLSRSVKMPNGSLSMGQNYTLAGWLNEDCSAGCNSFDDPYLKYVPSLDLCKCIKNGQTYDPENWWGFFACP